MDDRRPFRGDRLRAGEGRDAVGAPEPEQVTTQLTGSGAEVDFE